MPVATTQGKKYALAALKERREKNKKRERVDNGSLFAGSPMYFDCLGCGGEIVVPENYINKPDLCKECAALQALGWLE